MATEIEHKPAEDDRGTRIREIWPASARARRRELGKLLTKTIILAPLAGSSCRRLFRQGAAILASAIGSRQAS